MFLKRSDIDVNARDREGKTALVTAVARGHEEAVELLLQVKEEIGGGDLATGHSKTSNGIKFALGHQFRQTSSAAPEGRRYCRGRRGENSS